MDNRCDCGRKATHAITVPYVTSDGGRGWDVEPTCQGHGASTVRAEAGGWVMVPIGSSPERIARAIRTARARSARLARIA